MPEKITLHVNGQSHDVTVEPDTSLLYVLRDEFGLKGPKYGCGEEQCGACKVLVDGKDVPSCQLPVSHVAGMAITTVEGLGSEDALHPLQECILEEQAAQCGFCTAGMIISAQGLLNRVRYPSDDEIRQALENNLCRCGVYDRVRRAIKMRIGRPLPQRVYEVRQGAPLSQAATPMELPSSVRSTPDLDAWVRINEDDTITIFSGKAELGQGLKTALAQIAAEELDVSLDRIQVVMADTGQTPNEGGTTGSMSVITSGAAIRVAAAEARHHLSALAFEQLESLTPANDLDVQDGTLTDLESGRQTTYWELMGGKKFDRQITGTPALKDPAQYTVVGQAKRRIDLLNKVTGGSSFVHDMALPDMLHARVLRPPGYHARLVSFDIAAVREMPGVVDVVRDGSFVAVAANNEADVVRALERAKEVAIWDYVKTIPPQDALFNDLLHKPSHDNLIMEGSGVDGPIPPIQAPDAAAYTLKATYYRPYHMHGSLGPSAAAAHWYDDDTLTVWSHTQVAFNLQETIAQVLDIDPAQVRIVHREGAGCYGHNGADDVALDAALVARALPGQPVLLKWMRSDEHGWEPYGSAMVLQMQGSLDSTGKVIDWNHDVWSYGHSTRPRRTENTSGLLAAWHLEAPFPQVQPGVINGYHFGSHRNADPIYNFEKRRVVRHEVADSPLRISALRSLGAYANVFAIESFMDELAHAAKIDPLQFRLNHLNDERAVAVLEACAQKAGWQSRTSADGEGWGLAFARYKNSQCFAAIIVQLQVDRETGVIQLKKVTIAADAGQIINPDGLSNQLEGGFLQAASWTLYEQVMYNAQGVTSLDWESYPILRFPAAPVIQTVLLDRPEMPFLGSGEATQNPTPGAIANAVFDAVGIRLRHIPFTPEKVKAR